ncbi:hypothetical protein Bca4012_025274 [Brassica carinata]|uniref:Uncharacterized protein n=1 Tax=Brassica carinata TaxID=52824 RepID=A0A8X8AR67_BRACI|nr:hypothetical protein Bca52824_022321 [Brassica carinata]
MGAAASHVPLLITAHSLTASISAIFTQCGLTGAARFLVSIPSPFGAQHEPPLFCLFSSTEQAIGQQACSPPRHLVASPAPTLDFLVKNLHQWFQSNRSLGMGFQILVVGLRFSLGFTESYMSMSRYSNIGILVFSLLTSALNPPLNIVKSISSPLTLVTTPIPDSMLPRPLIILPEIPIIRFVWEVNARHHFQ